MTRTRELIRENRRFAKLRWRSVLGSLALRALVSVTKQFHFSVANGDLILLDSGWYVTHAGLARLACRRRCAGIKVQPVVPFAILPPKDGHLKRLSINPKAAWGSLVTATQIHLMSPLSSVAPRCGWLKPGPSTVPCARLTGSAS